MIFNKCNLFIGAVAALSLLPMTAPFAGAQQPSGAIVQSSEALSSSDSAAQSATSDSLALGLEDIFSLIDSDNRTLQMLRSGVEAAEEGVKNAKLALSPDINAKVSVSYIGNAFLTDRDFSNFTRTETPHFGNTFSIDASQVVYAGGAIKAGIDLAKYGLERSNLTLEKTRQSLRLVAAGQYLDLYRVRNGIKVYKGNISLTEKLISDIRIRREQGLALADDVTRYELQLQSLLLELERLQNTADVMNYRLCESLCLPEGTILSTDLPSSEADSGTPLGQWQDVAEQSSLTLRLARVGQNEADAARRVALSDMIPKIAIVAHDDLNGPITFEIPPINKNLNIWYVGLGVNYSFGSLYKSRAKLRQAEASSRVAAKAVDVSAENLRSDVKQAYSEYMLAFTELETRKKSLQLASENYDRVYYRYMEQLALVTDMLDAFTMKLNAEIGVADAEAEIQYRLCKLKYTAGTL